ncbi:hypothetical protein C0J52_28040 [Blattella germanica]|nr:hypothetical protein C0J52_28040 [Blattella germanica]
MQYQNQWTKQVHRMSNTRIPKAMLCNQPRGKRSFGRPMKRWSENPQKIKFRSYWNNSLMAAPRVFHYRPDGRRDIGRPRRRWKDQFSL